MLDQEASAMAYSGHLRQARSKAQSAVELKKRLGHNEATGKHEAGLRSIGAAAIGTRACDGWRTLGQRPPTRIS